MGTGKLWTKVLRLLTLGVVAGCGGGGGGVPAAPLLLLGALQAVLLGSLETTVVDADARAAVVVEVRSDGRIRFSATAEAAWVGDIIGMHIHRGAPGVDGPIEVDLLAAGATFDPGTRTATGFVFAAQALAEEIAASPGDFYVNIHTNAAPAGLVRQQLTGVPALEWHTCMTGDQETDVRDPDARGAASFRLAAPDTLEYTIAMARPTVTDLTDAHIHVGEAGVAGGIVVDLEVDLAAVDAGAGTLAGTAAIDLETLARILADPAGFYCNVHTVPAPAGVARGQLGTGTVQLWATLSGDQETTVIDESARGAVALFLESLTEGRVHLAVPSDTQDVLDIDAAHVHEGGPGVDGPSVIDLQAGADYSGATSNGSAEGAITYSQSIFTRLLADPDSFYANLHTAAAPDGLVRGQVTRDPETFFAALDGANEVDPVDPDATGTFVGVVSGNQEVDFVLTMSSPPATDIVGLHVHDGPAGEDGPILVDLLNTPSLDVTPTTITGRVEIAGRTFVRMLASPELFYCNAHTTAAPDGVARGQTIRADNGLPPAGLSYETPVVLRTGSAIQPLLPTILPGGGGITSFSIDPALPDGLQINTVTGNVSGTPTETIGATTFTVTGANSAGEVTASIEITVEDGPPANLVYSNNPATYTVGTAIATNVPSNTGGAIATYQVTAGQLPQGLTLNGNGTITGTPTATQAATNVTITGSNSSGSTQATLTITVNAQLQPPSISYSTPVVFTTGSAITPHKPTNTGGAVSSYTALTTLPAGLSLNTTNGEITGTPTTVTAAANHQVQASNAAGNHTATVNIEIKVGAPKNLTYSPGNGIGYVSTGTFSTMTASVQGGAVTTWSISPALTAGLSFNTSNGTISGTPTATLNQNYTVTASNSGGSTTANISILILQ